MSGRIAFLGSPDFAVASLQALLDLGTEVALVISQPDRPAGRGNQLRAPSVKAFAVEHGLPTLQPTKVRDGQLAAQLRALDLDVIVVAAYGRILPAQVLGAARRGSVNVHASLLPRWRGASPISRAIAAQDAQAGVCLMQMDEGMDTGAVLARASLPIADTDTTATLDAKLAGLGASLLAENWPAILAGQLVPTAQDSTLVTLAPPLDKSEGRIDWQRSASALHAHIRAMSPWPCATTHVPQLNEIWKIFPDDLQVTAGQGVPGTLLADDGIGAWVQCGQGRLRVTRIQRPDKRAMTASEVLRGVRFSPGEMLS